jgi:hypothetical protein
MVNILVLKKIIYVVVNLVYDPVFLLYHNFFLLINLVVRNLVIVDGGRNFVPIS